MGEVSGARALRVLIADDNEDAADMLAQLVRMRGYEVAVAHDGLEAISSAASFMPDVALLDIGMPELDGHQVAAELRKERGADVTLVAITGWGDDADKQRASSAGFDHHLTKPIDLDGLISWLAERSQKKHSG
jgi:CheY-like chemotaxis protein